MSLTHSFHTCFTIPDVPFDKICDELLMLSISDVLGIMHQREENRRI